MINIMEFKYSAEYHLGRYDEGNSNRYQILRDSLTAEIGPIYETWFWLTLGKNSVSIKFLQEQDYSWFLLKYK